MIHLSKAAVKEIIRLKTKQQNSNAMFRLGAKPGGCSKLTYTLEFDDTVQPEDRVYVCDGIQVVVASQNIHYLENLSLDYSEDLMGGGFRFHNPAITQSCGCGNSFTLD